MNITFDPNNPQDCEFVLRLIGPAQPVAAAAPAAQPATAPAPAAQPAAQPAVAPAEVTLDDLKKKFTSMLQSGKPPAEAFEGLKARVPGFTQLPQADPSTYPAIAAALDEIMAGG